MESGETLFGLIQTDAPITRGSSGGALLDSAARLVGITTAIAVSDVGAEGLGFAIPVDIALDVANDLIEDGVVSHAQLGIQGETALAEADGAEYPVGVRVTNVTADSAYDLGGGQTNDVITALDDVLVTSMETLLTELRTRRAGEDCRHGRDPGRRRYRAHRDAGGPPMSDDLFSKLFDLFDQPGPINWKLAAEVARHLSGETEPVEPWAAEEFRELARLGRVPNRADRPIPGGSRLRCPATGCAGMGGTQPRVLRLTGRTVCLVGGVRRAGCSSHGPAGAGDHRAPSRVAGRFTVDLGGRALRRRTPPGASGAISIVVPNIGTLVPSDSIDAKEIRLWIVTNEVAFRAVSQIRGSTTMSISSPPPSPMP